jgi:hypothetical protein
MKTLLLSLFVLFTFVTAFVHHIQFGPKGTSLPVSAGLIVFNSCPAFFLPVTLGFAKIAKFPIVVSIVAWSRTTLILHQSSLMVAPGLHFLPVLTVLECSGIVLLSIRVLLVYLRHGLFPFSFPLLGGCNVIHIIHCDCGMVLLGHDMAQFTGKGHLEELHFEELHHIVDCVPFQLLHGSSHVSVAIVSDQGHGFVLLAYLSLMITIVSVT